MKIGIVTLFGLNNYGNRLQNYAVQQVVRSLGFEAVTFPTSEFVPSKRERLENVLRRSIPYILHIVHSKLSGLVLKAFNRERDNGETIEQPDATLAILLTGRESTFAAFNRKYIQCSSVDHMNKVVREELAKEYHCFIVGSDQVWSSQMGLIDPFRFLQFVEPRKRVAFSASFGTSTLPKYYHRYYRKGISDMGYVSVREDDGKQIVHALTGRNSTLLIDPTMMLTKEDWRAIVEKPANKPNYPYLLLFFLGEIGNNTKLLIDSVSKNMGLTVVSLNDPLDHERFVIPPDQFVDFVDSASFIITDSFHGTAFSIIFEKPFIVCDRKGNTPSMKSRIETLLNKFGLLDRHEDRFSLSTYYESPDFSMLKSLLEREQLYAIQFLKEALTSRTK